jgi:hypothetical protein
MAARVRVGTPSPWSAQLRLIRRAWLLLWLLAGFMPGRRGG